MKLKKETQFISIVAMQFIHIGSVGIMVRILFPCIHLFSLLSMIYYFLSVFSSCKTHEEEEVFESFLMPLNKGEAVLTFDSSFLKETLVHISKTINLFAVVVAWLLGLHYRNSANNLPMLKAIYHET